MMGARRKPSRRCALSEKLLDKSGISVETLDLSEVFGRIGRLKDSDTLVAAKLKDIKGYARTASVPAESLMRMAKFGVVLDAGWETISSTRRRCSAGLLWKNTSASFLHADEHEQQQAHHPPVKRYCRRAGNAFDAVGIRQPSALVDWNNNYGDDR